VDTVWQRGRRSTLHATRGSHALPGIAGDRALLGAHAPSRERATGQATAGHRRSAEPVRQSPQANRSRVSLAPSALEIHPMSLTVRHRLAARIEHDRSAAHAAEMPALACQAPRLLAQSMPPSTLGAPRARPAPPARAVLALHGLHPSKQAHVNPCSGLTLTFWIGCSHHGHLPCKSNANPSRQLLGGSSRSTRQAGQNELSRTSVRVAPQALQGNISPLKYPQ
jgi:hypothetical protein